MNKNNREEYDALGSVAFTDSRLSWASKTWATGSDAESAKLARSFYFLVKSFEDRGNKSCVIETKKRESPDLDSKQLLPILAVFPNSESDVIDFAKKVGTNLSATSGQDFRSLHISGTPTIALVDSSGKVRKIWKGMLSGVSRPE